MNRFAWITPHSIPEASAAANALVCEAMVSSAAPAETALVKAGGIDLLDLMKENLLAPAKLINLRHIPGLDTVTSGDDGGLRIGALTTLAALAENATVRERYPALAAAVAGSASPQIRAVATLGGNLLQRPRCWYFRAEEYRCLRKGGGHCYAIQGENQYHAIFDNHLCAIVHPSTAATVLIALGATLELAGADGRSRRIRLEDFFVPPDRDLQRENDLQPQEILTSISLPPLPSGVRMAHLKQGEKDSFDWPLADVAVVLDLASDRTCKSASVVLGAAAPVPYRAKGAEVALAGKPVDDASAGDAAHAALEGATPLSRNAYKIPLFKALVRRAILEAGNAF